MKTAVVLALCIAAAVAFPQQRPQDVQIVSEANENDGSGNFRSAFALSDGTSRDENGQFTDLGKTPEGDDIGIQKVSGVISWTSPEGQLITLRYTADETGFHPEGDHLPRA